MDVIFARPYDYARAREWVDGCQTTVLAIAAGYVLSVFALQRWMRDRPPLRVDRLLIFWNVGLSAFSIWGMVVATEELLRSVDKHGVAGSWCYLDNFFTEQGSGRVAFFFTISKVVELGDSYFIVARKRPLVFLQWYHHALTLVYAFVSFGEAPAFNRWGSWMNLVVHSFMYTYFLARSLKVRVPMALAQSVTLIQIIQFLHSCFILLQIGVVMRFYGAKCVAPDKSFWLASFMDTTYLMLFVNFFYQSYIVGGKRKQQ